MSISSHFSPRVRIGCATSTCRVSRDACASCLLCCAVLLFFVCVFGWSAAAHDLARSESRCTVQGSDVQCHLIVGLLEVPGVDRDGNGTISYAELDQSIAAVFG